MYSHPAVTAKAAVGLLVVGLVAALMVLSAPSVDAAPEAYEFEMLRLINQDRAAAGLAPVQMHTAVANSSETWSTAQATGACGVEAICHDPRNAANIAAACGCRLVQWSENVGYSRNDVAYLHGLFMASPGHKRNILHASSRYVGIGLVVVNGRLTATVRFYATDVAQATQTQAAAPTATAPSGPGRSVVGDFTGNGRAEIFDYRPGSPGETIREGRSGGGLSAAVPARNVFGTYQPLVGDFDGDGRDDIFWYAPGVGGESIWLGTGTLGSFTTIATRGVQGTYRPLVGDFDGNGADDIFWYAPGGTADSVWLFSSRATRISIHGPQVRGTYTPFVGDFDGTGRDDIFWYAPGSAADYVWYGIGGASFASSQTAVNGSYRPAAGDFDGNGRDDVFWYAPGSTGDYLWYAGSGPGGFTSTPQSIGGDYVPATADFDGDGRDDLAWVSRGAVAALSRGLPIGSVLRLLGI